MINLFFKSGILAGLLSLFLMGCSLDYSQAILDEDLSEKIPDTSFNDFKDIKVKDNVIVNKLEAARAEMFGRLKKTVFYNLHFIQLDKKGTVLTEGWADQVVLHADTDNAEMTGSIRFYSASDEISISTENLFWENDTKRLYSNPENEVHLETNDGSFISGKGFEAFLNKRIITFQKGVTGKYVIEEESDEK
ncbi:MAG: LPS export ABC transporter periplasmic protein LptC [Spirochaetales bacterium]|nr:LPS export ABC transporter periplasmic protein LptC [Spirochaetales bacterium]